MKKLSCVDMGKSECRFVAQGETDEDVKMKMTEHIKSRHPEVMESTNEDDLNKTMDEKLTAKM